MNMKIVFAFIILFFTSAFRFDKDPVILQIGGENITLAEFRYVYEKNNSNPDIAYSEKSIREYLDLYINFKLKVQEAYAQQMDSIQDVRREFEVYQKQLSKPYLSENKVTDELVKQAYERLKEEIHASHILVKLPPNATPADTAAAYSRLKEIRRRAMANEDFGNLAAEYSDEPAAKTSKGDLGYFTALQMIYSFEDEAYRTPVGQISEICRTGYGYHIIKVHKRRTSNGSIRVAHLMLRHPANGTKDDSTAVLSRIKEIERRMRNGENWNNLCATLSEDVGTRDKNGELEWFTAGNLIQPFEEAAFGLQNAGDISPAVQTPYGWHLIKMLERKPLEAFKSLEPVLKKKVSKDSRSELNKIYFIKKLKKENEFDENKKAKEWIADQVTPSLLEGNWRFNRSEKNLEKNIFQIKDQKYLLKDFMNYLEKNQKKNLGKDAKQYAMNVYETFINESLMTFEEKNLESKYPDYRYLLKEYREGIMLFKIMEQNVWGKSLSDEAGLRKYFEENQNKYRMNSLAHAVIYDVNSEETLLRLKEELKKEVFPNPSANYSDCKFSLNSDVISEVETSNLNAVLTLMLASDTAAIVELNTYSLPNEKADISKKRIEAVKKYFSNMNITSKRIAEKDLGKLTAAQAKQKGNKGGIEIKMYSKSKKMIEKLLNQANPLALKITEGKFEKGKSDIVNNTNWTVGEHKISVKDRIYLVIISKIEPERAKKLDEAKGQAISDFQNYLEKQWLEKLRGKYKVTVNEDEVQKLIRK
ncbi:MAG: peptidylprolyl isomerase [Bacteroidetes bacterium]|nr:MAG: peptidylprolyl isomerase [Bacteroidota bacterium]